MRDGDRSGDRLGQTQLTQTLKLRRGETLLGESPKLRSKLSFKRAAQKELQGSQITADRQAKGPGQEHIRVILNDELETQGIDLHLPIN